MLILCQKYLIAESEYDEYFASYKKKVRYAKKHKCETVDDVMNNFKDQCQKHPVYIRTACHSLLWRKGVEQFKIDNYSKISAEV